MTMELVGQDCWLGWPGKWIIPNEAHVCKTTQMPVCLTFSLRHSATIIIEFS